MIKVGRSRLRKLSVACSDITSMRLVQADMGSLRSSSSYCFAKAKLEPATNGRG
jgi:hypothetical protein